MTDPVGGMASFLSCEVRCEKSFRGLLCNPMKVHRGWKLTWVNGEAILALLQQVGDSLSLDWWKKPIFQPKRNNPELLVLHQEHLKVTVPQASLTSAKDKSALLCRGPFFLFEFLRLGLAL